MGLKDHHVRTLRYAAIKATGGLNPPLASALRTSELVRRSAWWFRFFSIVARVWRWFGVGRSAFPVVSSARFVGPCLVSVVVLRVSRCFFLSFCVSGGFVSFVTWIGAPRWSPQAKK